MSRIAAMIAKGRELGLKDADILAMIEAGEAHSSDASRTARQDRNARYYERKKAERLNKTSEQDVLKASESVLNPEETDTPRARVLCVVNSNIKNKTSNDVLKKGGKGTRIGGDWTPEPRDWHFAISELGDAADRELAKFRDYWIGRAGAGGVKLDWSATWRNWVRKAADDRKARAGPAPKVTPEYLLRQAMKIGEFADGGGNSFEPDRASGPVIEGVGYSSVGGSQRA